MTASAGPGAASPIESLPNLRDLGGWIGLDSRPVRSGRLFRSTDFRSLSSEQLPELAGLGVRTIYDLRSAAERSALPDPILDQVADVFLDVLADAKLSIPANLETFFSDPERVAKASSGQARDAVSAISGTYRGLVSYPSARAAYRRFYQGLLGADRGPALFHCTTGKDRTGWAAASFLALMGVSRDDIYRDYLLTNDRLLPALRPLFEKFAAAGGDPEVLPLTLGVQASYLDTAFAEMANEYGTIEGYFARGLGIDQSAQQALRAAYLVD